MAELVNGDALIVVAIAGEVEQVLLAEAGHGETAGAAHPFVLVRRVRAVPVLGHVRVNLVLADNDQARAVFDHRLEDVGPAGKQWLTISSVRWSASSATSAEAMTGIPLTSMYFL